MKWMTLLMAVISFSASAAQLSLAWDQSPDSTIAGYNVYWGVTSGSYTNLVQISGIGNCVVTISKLVSGTTYFFAATAYTRDAVESEFSAELQHTMLPYSPKALRLFK